MREVIYRHPGMIVERYETPDIPVPRSIRYMVSVVDPLDGSELTVGDLRRADLYDLMAALGRELVIGRNSNPPYGRHPLSPTSPEGGYARARDAREG